MMDANSQNQAKSAAMVMAAGVPDIGLWGQSIAPDTTQTQSVMANARLAC